VTPAMPEMAGEAEVAAADQVQYIGMVKSYNARRGFGFVACAATAEKYGRDVYIAKAEAQLAYAEGSTPPTAVPARPVDKLQMPSLAEEDLIRFRVRLSVEGYPQAEQIQRLRKFQGTIMQPPPFGDESDTQGRIVSDELAAVFGHSQREAVLRRSSCGQTRLAVGDRVTFCVQSDAELLTTPSGHRLREALLIMLVPRLPQSFGCPSGSSGGILGCFVLNLPRAPIREGWPRPDLKLDCHAISDRLILSNLPPDTDDAELMRFFSKHGALGAAIAHAKSGSFASVTFPSASEPTRFVARSVHTFADDKETRLARLEPRCHDGGSICGAGTRLPGLPAPMLSSGIEPGMLVVTWSPVVLATGYSVDLRPAGVQANWSTVDASNGQLGGDGGGRFGRDVSCCKVTGLPTNMVFEARITYYTTCGCQSDASDPSEWCIAVPVAPAPAPAMSLLTVGAPQLAVGAPNGGMKLCWPQAWSNPWQQAMAAQTAPATSMQQPQQLCGAWRCVHGAVVPPPPMPELRAGDDAGFAIVVQWPSVAHATAYVVELRESCSAHFERFIRSVPLQAQGSLVELRIGGLRPVGGPGRTYIAQVRSVAPCGCESEPSAQGMSEPVGAALAPSPMPAATMPQGLPTLSLAAACPPPAAAPAMPCKMPPQSEQAKLGPQHIPSPIVSTSPLGGKDELPSLLKSSRPPVPPPAGPSPSMAASIKEPPPEVAGNEDCIILD